MLIRDLPGANGIKFGNLWLKSRNIEAIASRCCRMVLFEADNPELPLGRTGASTLVRFGGRRFVVMTRHELGLKRGAEPQIEILNTIRVAGGGEVLKNIPLTRCIFEDSNPDEEYHDILIFEVASGWNCPCQEDRYFFSIRGFSQLERAASLVYGCPNLPEVMGEYIDAHAEGEVGTIHQKTAVENCTYARGFRSHAAHYRRYDGVSDSVGDGFSGGPVFSLVDRGDGFEVLLDGIVVRAGKGHVHIVDADYLEKILAHSAS